MTVMEGFLALALNPLKVNGELIKKTRRGSK
jgi:hypothetical protein